MPEKFKSGLEKKLDKTAVRIEKRAENLKPSFKVKSLYNMFKKLHLEEKLWEIDNRYWKDMKEKGELK